MVYNANVKYIEAVVASYLKMDNAVNDCHK